MSGLLEGFSDHTLMLGAGTSSVVVEDLSVGRHEAAQGLSIFVVNGTDFVAAKITLLFDLGLIVSGLGSHWHNFKE